MKNSRHQFLGLRWNVHHRLSRLVGRICECQWIWVKNTLIRAFMYWYQINLSNFSKEKIEDYKNINDFFLRTFKKGVRQFIKQTDKILSPVDGRISQMGHIKQETLLQAKGRTYSLSDLVGNDAHLVNTFQEGYFMTLYLSPKDYHRVHMPVTGILKQTTYIPGLLFSVNRRNTQRVSQLFTRNERVISLFKTDVGSMAIVQVGAFLVGNIATQWEGLITSSSNRPQIRRWNYHQAHHRLQQTEEMGYFKLGSTVILLFSKDHVIWDNALSLDQRVVCGEVMGNMNAALFEKEVLYTKAG